MKIAQLTLLVFLLFTVSGFAQNIPRTVDSNIQKSAQSKYPDDYEMQEYKIKEQRQAYLNLQSLSANDIPKEVLQEIIGKAVA
jgi:hypothetical protein